MNKLTSLEKLFSLSRTFLPLKRRNIYTNEAVRNFQQTTRSNSRKISHLFIQNAKVNDFNQNVHNVSANIKYNMKAQDSVVGANSLELRNKILKQIPNDLRKTNNITSCYWLLIQSKFLVNTLLDNFYHISEISII